MIYIPLIYPPQAGLTKAKMYSQLLIDLCLPLQRAITLPFIHKSLIICSWF